MTTRIPISSLSLPASIQAEAERLDAAQGMSLDQLVPSAVAERAAALRTVSYFAKRPSHADWPAFDRLMARSSGEPPRPGDEASDDQSTVGWGAPTHPTKPTRR